MKTILKIAAFLAFGLLIGAASAQTAIHANYILLAGTAPSGMDMTGSTAISPALLAVSAGNVSSSATITQVVNANASIAATVSIKSSVNPSNVGQMITYTVSVAGANNGSSPTGTVTVTGITGTQTVTLANGSASCTETPTAPSAGFKVVATYNGDSNFF